jgi:hypothetical protein
MLSCKMVMNTGNLSMEWLDVNHLSFCFSCSSFAALFSPAKRRQMETQDSTPRRPPILGRHSPGRELDEVDRGVPLALAAGYCNTGVIPVLRKTGRKQGRLALALAWPSLFVSILTHSLSFSHSLPLCLSISLPR